MLDGFMAVVLPLYVAHSLSAKLALPTPLVAGLLLSIAGFVDSILLPGAGFLSDRVGRRKLLIQIGRLLITFSLFVFTTWSSVFFVAALRVLQGIGIALLLPSSLTLISEYMPAGSQATAMGHQSTFRTLGGVLGPILGGFIQGAVGFEMSFGMMGAVWLIITLLIAFFVRDLPTYYRKGTHFDEPINPSKKREGYLTLQDLVLLGTANFSIAYSFTMIAALEQNLNERLSQTAVAFGVAYGATSFVRLVLQIPMGHFADKFRKKSFIVLGLGLMGLTTLGLDLVATTGQLITLRILQGLGMTFVMIPLLGLVARRSASESRARNMGIVTSGFGLGMGAGPLMTGLLASYLSLGFSFLFCTILCFSAMLLVLVRMQPNVSGAITG
jgi:MFS family permease